MVFPVVMYGCERWTIKKAEHQRIDAFELWCWRRLLRVPCVQGDPSSPSWRISVLNIHWKGWYWSWNSNTLATWCEEPTHRKRPWCWERLKAGGEGDNRGWDGWMASLTRWIRVWVASGSWWRTGKPGVLPVHGVAESQTWLSNWTELKQSWARTQTKLGAFNTFLSATDKITRWKSAKMYKMWTTQLIRVNWHLQYINNSIIHLLQASIDHPQDRPYPGP